MGRRTQRKRSKAVTLVLAGSATLGGCGAPVEQRDAYASLDACVRDWNDAAQCEPVRDHRFASNYFYGPRYYGASFPDGRPRPSANAMDAVYVAARSPSSTSRSWFSPGSFRFSSSASHSSGGASRGGFGSTGHSFSSSGS